MVTVAKEAEEDDFSGDQTGPESESELRDWQLPLAFCKERHLQKIESSKAVTQTWRMKERVKCSENNLSLDNSKSRLLSF